METVTLSKVIDLLLANCKNEARQKFGGKEPKKDDA